MSDRAPIPRDPGNDYTSEMAERRAEFLREKTGKALNHVGRASFDPAVLPGNIENFMGVAQVPIGLAGPLRINGEHAQGDFYVRMATTEGTLVASYNRGMRLLSEGGGVRATVVERSCSARPCSSSPTRVEARDFGEWISEHFDDVKRPRRVHHARRPARRDRAVRRRPPALPALQLHDRRRGGPEHDRQGDPRRVRVDEASATRRRPNYMLSGSIDTDKKHSAINIAADARQARRRRGRDQGRRAAADHGRRAAHAVLGPPGVERRRASWPARPTTAPTRRTASPRCSSPPGRTSPTSPESHAGIIYTQLLDNGDYYWSITLTSLIVATDGGGTGLATQRECLEMLGCYGPGKADKLAEICAAVVLAGEISLGSAVLAGDWVSSHERLGRNRP